MALERPTRHLPTTRPSTLRELHTWALHLPWVVERPTSLCSEVRMFGVECASLHIRRMFLVTGLGDDGDDDPRSVSVIVPERVGDVCESVGWARPCMAMPRQHLLMRSLVPVESGSATALVLIAHQHALRADRSACVTVPNPWVGADAPLSA